MASDRESDRRNVLELHESLARSKALLVALSDYAGRATNFNRYLELKEQFEKVEFELRMHFGSALTR